MIEENINKIVDPKNIIVNADNALVRIKKDIVLVGTTTKSLKWTDLGISTIKELMDNFWELKDSSVDYIKNNPDGKSILIAKKVVAYYEIIKSKLLELKSIIDDYNKKFPNNKLQNIEELIHSEIKSSVSSLKEEILRLSKI